MNSLIFDSIKTVAWRLTIAALIAAVPAAAAQTLTPQQLEQLRNLSPEQRQAILDALQGMDGAGTRARPMETPELVLPIEEEEPEDDEAEVDVLEAGDTVAIRLTPPEDAEILHEDLLNAIGSRVYELDKDGAVALPMVGRVRLAGLDADGVVLRLQSVPELAEFDIEASVLSLAPTGAAALEPFGYALFSGVPTTFAPATDIPVPTDYTIGVGDTINVQMFGNETTEMSLVVGRDGQVSLPSVGPVVVAGLSFEQMREDLIRRIEEQSVGVSAAVSMGELRSIRVFVLGDVKRPGSYTVSGLSTMTNALFVSGGLLQSGSMRNVQLKRDNRVVSRLDLYDLLLRGNTRADARLKPGDVIFVPPVGEQLSIYGQVLRPAIYEFRGEKTLGDLIELAGGLLPSAFRGEAQVLRFNDRGRTSILSVPLDLAGSRSLAAGDIVRIMPVLERLDNAVSLSGHVLRPGERQWSSGMRLTDLIGSADMLDQQADLDYVLVHRRVGPNRLSRLLSANLGRALASPGSVANVALEPLDEVIVFSLGADRAERIRPLLDKVRAQAEIGSPTSVVTIVGQVRAPGDYPLEPQMRVSDLVRAAGGLLESAYVEQAELTRQIAFDGGERRLTVHETVGLAATTNGNDESDPLLQNYDFITVRETPDWRAQETITIRGEVRFPGTYALRRGEHLSSVIERAGGLTEFAFTEGSVFLRAALKDREAEQLESLAERVRREISALPVDAVESRSSAEQLLLQLEDTDPVGRLVIDLDDLMANPGNESVDILVKEGDELIVPPRSQEVTVIGEVQYATSHIYTPGIDRRGYILKSGGVTANADERRIYVVRANGNVVASSRSAWFNRRGAGSEIRPGDTIVVPLDADRISGLSLWTSVTQIVYNIGVAAAAVASF